MKSKTNIIHLVIVGVLTIGFISGCKKEEDPKYKSWLCPRCYGIQGPMDNMYYLFGKKQCDRCGQKLGVGRDERQVFCPFMVNRSYIGGLSDAQAAKFLAEAKAEEAAKAKAEREYEEAMNPEPEEAEAAP